MIDLLQYTDLAKSAGGTLSPVCPKVGLTAYSNENYTGDSELITASLITGLGINQCRNITNPKLIKDQNGDILFSDISSVQVINNNTLYNMYVADKNNKNPAQRPACAGSKVSPDLTTSFSSLKGVKFGQSQDFNDKVGAFNIRANLSQTSLQDIPLVRCTTIVSSLFKELGIGSFLPPLESYSINGRQFYAYTFSAKLNNKLIAQAIDNPGKIQPPVNSPYSNLYQFTGDSVDANSVINNIVNANMLNIFSREDVTENTIKSGYLQLNGNNVYIIIEDLGTSERIYVFLVLESTDYFELNCCVPGKTSSFCRKYKPCPDLGQAVCVNDPNKKWFLDPVCGCYDAYTQNKLNNYPAIRDLLKKNAIYPNPGCYGDCGDKAYPKPNVKECKINIVECNVEINNSGGKLTPEVKQKCGITDNGGNGGNGGGGNGGGGNGGGGNGGGGNGGGGNGGNGGNGGGGNGGGGNGGGGNGGGGMPRYLIAVIIGSIVLLLLLLILFVYLI